MKTRILHTKVWEDRYFYALEDKEKLAFLYLLTNDSINLSGTYELNDIKLVTWLRTTPEVVEQIKAKFQNDGRFAFYKGWVRVLNYDKYNNYSGNLNDKAKEREISLIPQEITEFFNTLSIPYTYPIDTAINHKSEIINHKSEIINKKEDPKITEILSHFNQTFEKEFRTTASWEDNALFWLETYSLEEIKKAITNWKDNGWFIKKGDENPTVLFRTRNKEGKCDYIGDLLNSKKRSMVINA